MTDVYYIWRLKQLQNKIYRKLKAIKLAAEKDNVDAISILNFYYNSLRLVYLLDDNTLTISKVNQDLSFITSRIELLKLNEQQLIFNEAMLADF